MTPIASVLLQAHEYKEWFLSRADSMSESELTTPPSSDEWCLKNILEHLVIIEERIVGRLQNLRGGRRKRRSLAELYKYTLMNVIFKFGIRVPVPMPEVEPLGQVSLEEIKIRWEDARKKLNEIIAKLSPDELGHFSFRHPFGGPLSVKESVEMISSHLKYHKIRAVRIYKSLT